MNNTADFMARKAMQRSLGTAGAEPARRHPPPLIRLSLPAPLSSRVMTATNGHNRSHSDELREARAQLRLARTRRELREEQLRESWYAGFTSFSESGRDSQWGGLADPSDRYREADRWLFSPWGGPHQRDDGKLGPLIPDETALANQRDLARLVRYRNPVACGIVEGLVDFLVGEGFTFKAATREGAPSALLSNAQDEIDAFIESCAYDELQAELVDRAVTDGEYFLRYLPEESDYLELRVLEPEHVQQPLASPREWLWGIETVAGDVQTEKAIAYSPDGPEAEWLEIKREEYQHAKRNVPRNVKRGLSDFFGTRDALESIWKVLHNMRVGEGIRAAIAGFWEYELAGAEIGRASCSASRESRPR